MGKDTLDQEKAILLSQHRNNLDQSDLHLDHFLSSTESLPNHELMRFMQYMEEGKSSICSPWQAWFQNQERGVETLRKLRKFFACQSVLHYLSHASNGVEQCDSPARRKAIRVAKMTTVFKVYLAEFQALSELATEIGRDEQCMPIIGRYRETSRLLFQVCETQKEPAHNFRSVIENWVKLEKERSGDNPDKQVLSKAHMAAIQFILKSSVSSEKKLEFLRTVNLDTLRTLQNNIDSIEGSLAHLEAEQSIQDLVDDRQADETTDADHEHLEMALCR